MRTIGVVTAGRADYGHYRPVLDRLKDEPGMDPLLFVGGAHLSPEMGMTVEGIEADGFPIAERVAVPLSADTPEAIARATGLATVGFAEAYTRTRPDVLLVLGDRYEMMAAVTAALPFKIPVAHIHGGEVTHGAIDDAFRHSITKMSHLHFASAEEYARRIVRMGEEPWRVEVTGSPSLDGIEALEPLPRDELERRYGIELDPPPLMVTYHPVTLEYEQVREQMSELLSALDGAEMPAVFTHPGADTGYRSIVRMTEEYANNRPGVRVLVSMGSEGYFSLMGVAAAMVGNSSSGIIEAPSFKLPVVNVGMRQTGRIRAANVIDVGNSRESILGGIRTATSAEFKRSLSELVNPYGDGHAAERIVDRLGSVCLDDRLLVKRFHDGGGP